jgi:hypothetical protein
MAGEKTDGGGYRVVGSYKRAVDGEYVEILGTKKSGQLHRGQTGRLFGRRRVGTENPVDAFQSGV